MSRIFDEIAKCGINIDMISMAPTHAYTGMSFTISDNDLIDIPLLCQRCKKETDIKVIVQQRQSQNFDL